MSAIIFAVLLAAGGKAGARRDSDSSQRRAAEGREETRNDSVRYCNKIHFESFRYCIVSGFVYFVSVTYCNYVFELDSMLRF